jgi:DNA helicase-2/ATP-dependent DNA helicase PcrA
LRPHRRPPEESLQRHGITNDSSDSRTLGTDTKGINFESIPKKLYRCPRSNTRAYYFSSPGVLWRDRVTDFACLLIEKSGGLSIERIKGIYDSIVVDEAQDLAGWDLELIEILLRSGLNIKLVGDPFQSTYATNSGTKNSQYRGRNILRKFLEWEASGLVRIQYSVDSFRCVREICEFTNALFLGELCMRSQNLTVTEHDGMFLVEHREVGEYIKKYSPQVLRYDRRSGMEYCSALNYGESKGLTFDRVLIIPHGPLTKYLQSGNAQHLEKSIEKVYVALTRARQSVAFLVADGFSSPVVGQRFGI